VESLKAYLREKELLLVVDNLEQVLEGAPLVGEILGACPKLKVLATSRIPLRLYGEREYPVPPLALPDPSVLPPLEVLTHYEAVRLFVERAQDARPDFTVTNENAPAVAEICARLDGLPLAIELAAARIRMLPPQKMLQRLSDRLKLLKGGARDLPARQQTLKGAIDWSYDLLEEDEKKLFGRLSVFAGGRTLETIEQTCDPDGDLEALEGVESLLEKSLLRQEERPGGEPRFVMLETVHEYAREKLDESGEEQEIKRAHAEYFLELAEEAEPELKGPDQVERMDRLETEHENFRAALSWSLGDANAALGVRLGGALWWFWAMRGHLSEGRKWLEEGLARTRSEPTEPRAKALSGLGFIATAQGDLEQATEPLEEGLALYRELGDGAGTASASTFLGYVAEFRGDIERARTLGEEALTLSRRLGDGWNEGFALTLLARTAYNRGDREKAAALWEQSLVLARKTGDTWSISWALRDLGWLALVEGDFERAAAKYEETLKIDRDLRDKTGVLMSLTNLGWAFLHQNNYELARALFGEGLQLSREMGAMIAIAECLEAMAGVAAARKDAERTALLWGAADALREEIGVPLYEAELPLHEPYRTFARSELDEAAFGAAFEEGRNMAPQEAIAYALTDEGADARTGETPT
jgi:predicted ATPase/Tfp pilus assembly protein PilF